MGQIRSFEDLDCWKKGRQVKRLIAELTIDFPPDERFDLVNNMRRAARSVTRNIAEGFGRHHHKENVRFCLMSRGSLYELIDDLITAREESYITERQYNQARDLIEEALRLLNGYIKYLRSKT